VTGSSSQSGFSLVEILVVLTLIAAVAGLTVTALPNRDHEAAMFAARLADRIELAADEALLTRRAAVLDLSATGRVVLNGGETLNIPAGVSLEADQRHYLIDPTGGVSGFVVQIRAGAQSHQVIFNGLDAQLTPVDAP
tara:strand:+ start:53 stop:466 length:414 start_codon:yes stop_codon:yes gene_type:complete